jgi:arginine/ornithine transport system substrate-binding protein
MKRYARLLLITAAACATFGAPLAHAKEWTQVNVATDATFPPFESVAPDGSLTGYDIDLIHALCDRMQVKCNVINAAWSGMFPGLLGKKYDALISSLNITEERKRVMAFTDVYEFPVYRFVGPKSEHLAITPEGLKGKTIAVQTGTPMDNFITQRFGNVATIKRYESGSEPYLDLASGRADLHFSYQAQIDSSFLSKPENAQHFGLIGPAYTGKDSQALGEGVAIAVRKQDDDLRLKFNTALAQLRKDGELKKINDKWFGAGSNVTQ